MHVTTTTETHIKLDDKMGTTVKSRWPKVKRSRGSSGKLLIPQTADQLRSSRSVVNPLFVQIINIHTLLTN